MCLSKSPEKSLTLKPINRFSHIFDKKETTYDKITFGRVGEFMKYLATNTVKKPCRGAAIECLLAIDQEIPIQPISNKSTNGKQRILKN